MTSANTVSNTMRPRNPSMGNTKSKRKSTSLPPETVDYLKNWMMSPEHIAHPYPTEQEKVKIMDDTGIELKQLTNWFVNNRKRFWKPRVEARLQEQSKAKDLPKLPLKPSPEAPVAIIPKAITKVVSNATLTSLDNSHQASTTVTPTCSPGRAVSESETSSSNGSGSDNSSVSSEEVEEEVAEEEHTARINLHLLKPVSGAQPSEADMTTLSNIPQERILRSFKDCYITYYIPANATLKQEQSRRDVELMRLKKHFLSVHFQEKAMQELNNKKKRPACALFDAVENVDPRPKYRRVSIDCWKDACKTACNIYDEALPSLEEATQLFGYSEN